MSTYIRIIRRLRWFTPGLLVAGVLCINTAWAHQFVPAEQDASVSLSVGIIPQQSAKKIHKYWIPIFDYLMRHTGYRFHLHLAPDIPTFEQRILQGEYDIAYMNPYLYTVAYRVQGYSAFAREKGKRLKGIIVVSKDSSYHDIKDLHGKKIVFPRNAFAASDLAQALLTQMNITFTPSYVKTHDMSYGAVAQKIFSAGGGVPRTFNTSNPKVQANLRVLWITNEYTPHALAYHPRVPKEMVEQIGREIEAMNKNTEGKTLLKELDINGFVRSVDTDWDDVRSLSIQRQIVIQQTTHGVAYHGK